MPQPNVLKANFDVLEDALHQFKATLMGSSEGGLANSLISKFESDSF